MDKPSPMRGQPRIKRSKLFGKKGLRGARSGNRPGCVDERGIVLMNPSYPLDPVPPAPDPVPTALPANFRFSAETSTAHVDYSVGLQTGRGTATIRLKAGGQRIVALTRDDDGHWFSGDAGRHRALEEAIAAAGL
jgi:Iap family predicted aminopeptidase